MKPIKLIKKNIVWIILVAIGLLVFACLKQPVFFDNFGVGVFVFLLISSLYMLTKRKYSEILLWIILAIGGSGIIVDLVNILK